MCFDIVDQSPKQWIKNTALNYSTTILRHFDRVYPNEQKPLKVEVVKNVTKMFYYKTIYTSINNIVYGWLKRKLDIIDELRCRRWIKYYMIDASAQTIPHKLGKQGGNNIKYVLDATDSHMCDKYGYLIGDTRFLERGGESYKKIIVEQLGHHVALNIRQLKHQHQNGLHIKLSLDTGTEVNPDNIRNCIVQGIHNKLNMAPHQSVYINVNCIKTDLSKLQVTV